jgi:hypothetical protein
MTDGAADGGAGNRVVTGNVARDATHDRALDAPCGCNRNWSRPKPEQKSER